MGLSPYCYIPSFIEIVPLVPGKKIFKWILPYRGMAQYYIPSLIEIGPLVPEENIFEWFLPYMGMAAILVKWPASYQ